jgi:hypothetical protein
MWVSVASGLLGFLCSGWLRWCWVCKGSPHPLVLCESEQSLHAPLYSLSESHIWIYHLVIRLCRFVALTNLDGHYARTIYQSFHQPINHKSCLAQVCSNPILHRRVVSNASQKAEARRAHISNPEDLGSKPRAARWISSFCFLNPQILKNRSKALWKARPALFLRCMYLVV